MSAQILKVAILIVLMLIAGGAEAPPDGPLWGYADLHTHPASHLAFGADSDGNGGIFWGKPGLVLEASGPMLSSDMAQCGTETHTGLDADFVRWKTRQTIITTIDDMTGYTHGPFGSPAFTAWPKALSLNHQQMHISAIRRAYDGGLRLMIANAAD